MKLRPHHIFCTGFLTEALPERGESFLRVEQTVRDVVCSDDETPVEAAEGVDELCHVCPHCRDDRCEHPRGKEEGVRKWDGILMKNLGISYGETRTSREWRLLIREKAPLGFCQTRCPSRSGCTISRYSSG